MSDTEPILSPASPPELKENKESKESKGAAAKEMQKILAGKRMAQQQARVDEVVGIMRQGPPVSDSDPLSYTHFIIQYFT